MPIGDDVDRIPLESLLHPGTPEEARRNALLQAPYEPDAYEEGITGYAGQNQQRVWRIEERPAVRTRVGGRGYYKGGLARLPDGTLFAAPCRPVRGPGGPHDVSFRISVFRSDDGGETWNDTGAEGLMGKEPALLALPDGTLVLTAQYYEQAVWVPRMPVSRSTDGGRTFETTWLEANRDYPRNLIWDEAAGEIVMIRSKARKYWYETHEESSPHLEVARSADAGRTWRRETGLLPWDFTGYSELASLLLPDGRFLVAIRREPPGTKGEGFEDTLLTESTDGGRTFRMPWLASHTGEVHWHLLRLRDGRILATWSNYHLPYGIQAAVSTDGGRTFDLAHATMLALSSDYYVGWPVTVEFADGTLGTLYASTPFLSQKPDSTACEFVRWSLET